MGKNRARSKHINYKKLLQNQTVSISEKDSVFLRIPCHDLRKSMRNNGMEIFEKNQLKELAKTLKKDETYLLENVFFDYYRTVRNTGKKPFKLDFSQSNSSEFNYELTKIKILSNPANINTLVYICNDHLNNTFGENAADFSNYGITKTYKFSDIPNEEYTRNGEKFIFTYNDEIREALIKAPKFPLSKPIIKKTKTDVNVFVQKVIMMIKYTDKNNIVYKVPIIGEISIEKNSRYNSVAQNVDSSIKLSVYYKGLLEGKMTVDHWDYLPLKRHPNKFDKDKNFILNGYLPEDTEFSHSHSGYLIDRLLFTQNQSLEIYPTVINANLNKDEEEKKYSSFDDMIAIFGQYCNLHNTIVPQKLIKDKPLKKFALDYLPYYDIKEKCIVQSRKPMVENEENFYSEDENSD